MPVRPERRLRAGGVAREPIRLAAAITRARVRASTRPLPLSACETVVSETPATAATSRTVGRSPVAIARQRSSRRGLPKHVAQQPQTLGERRTLDFAKTCWLRSPRYRSVPARGGRYVADERRTARAPAAAVRRAGCGPHRRRAGRRGLRRLGLGRKLVRRVDHKYGEGGRERAGVGARAARAAAVLLGHLPPAARVLRPGPQAAGLGY